MARIRTIKPEFWDDEELAKIPMQARLLFIGIWNFADDYGVILSSPKYIKSKVFPYDTTRDEQVKVWLDALSNARMLVSFSCLGKDYYVIRTFKSHQIVDKRYTKSILPNSVSADEILAGLALDKNTECTHSEHVVDTGKSSVVCGSGIGSVSGSGDDVYRKFAHLKISVSENEKLLAIGYSKVQIDDMLDRIKNYSKNKNYVDLYLTALKWLKKDYPNVTEKENECPYTPVQIREVKAQRASGFGSPEWFDPKYENLLV